MSRQAVATEQDDTAVAARMANSSAASWPPGANAAFFDHLAATGDVAAAAARAQVGLDQVYARLRTRAGFAAAWRSALKAACLTVEAMMIRHVLASADTIAAAGCGGLEWNKAQRLVELHASLTGGGKGGAAKGDRSTQVATRDQTDTAILKGLASIAAKAERGGKPV